MESNVTLGQSLGDSFLLAFLLARDFTLNRQDPSQLAEIILKAVPAGLLPDSDQHEMLQACRARMDKLTGLAAALEIALRAPGATPSPESPLP